MGKIRRQQQAIAKLPLFQNAPPKHQPEVLYIGCIDARLDPIDDIGIEKGTALIFRNIAALVPKHKPAGSSPDIVLDNEQDVPQNISVGAALEFFLNHIPLERGSTKHVVVSGHTDCGGLKACQHNVCGENDHDLPRYLEILRDVRIKIMQEAKAANWSEAQTLHALEEESVRQSIANLQTYPMVCEALEKGYLEIHGWVINTATQSIFEMNPKTLEFEPMTSRQPT